MPILNSILTPEQIKIEIWHITETVDELLNLVILTPAGRRLFNSYRNEKRKKEWLASRLLLQNLNNGNPVTVRYTKKGRPFKQKSMPWFSISHTTDYVAVASSISAPIGVDIENISDRILKIKNRFLSSIELNQLNDTSDIASLMTCWCIKEATIKHLDLPGIDFQNNIQIQISQSKSLSHVDVQINAKKNRTLTAITPSLSDKFILSYTINPIDNEIQF